MRLHSQLKAPACDSSLGVRSGSWILDFDSGFWHGLQRGPEGPIRIPDSGFWILDFWIPDLDSGFWIWILDSGPRTAARPLSRPSRVQSRLQIQNPACTEGPEGTLDFGSFGRPGCNSIQELQPVLLDSNSWILHLHRLHLVFFTPSSTFFLP